MITSADGEPCDDAAARMQQSGNELQLHVMVTWE